MAKKSRQSFLKRQREAKRAEKAAEKRQKRQERRDLRASGELEDDPDIASPEELQDIMGMEDSDTDETPAASTETVASPRPAAASVRAAIDDEVESTAPDGR